MKINNLIKNQQFMFLAIVLVTGFMSLWVVGDLSTPILTSIVLALLFRPMQVYFTIIGLPEKFSVFVTFLIVVLLAILFFLIFIPLFINEANRYWNELPNLVVIAEPLLELLGQYNAPNESIEGAQSFLSEIAGFASEALSFSISRLQDTANLLLTLILVPIFLFFWLWDTDTLSSGFSKLVPKKRKFLVKVWNETNTNFQSYFKAKFVEVFVVALTGSLMFWALGLNSPVLLGVSFGLSQLIPFFGPVFMTFPVLIVSLAQFGLDPYVIVILLFYALLQNIDGNIFLPFLMSGVVKLPAVVVLLSVFLFGAIFGIWGVFFAVPIASFIKSLMDNWKYIDS